MSAFKTWLAGLTAKTTLTGTENLYIEDGGASKLSTFQNLMANITGALGTLGETVTASKPVLLLTQTWNNVAVTFTAMRVNVTDTTSAAGSLLADFQAGGVSKFSVKKTGAIESVSGAVFNSTVTVSGAVVHGGSGFQVGNNGSISFSNGSVYSAHLRIDTTDTLAQRNGTNAQTFRNYGTYTDASNYRRVALSMTTAGVATLLPEGAGTGASGNVLHISGLPTSNPGAGILWNNAGTPAIGT